MKSLINKINKYRNLLIYILFLFSAYCAVTVGQSWDEGFHIIQGKIILNYLLSFGNIDKELLYRENYSSLYWSLSYLLTKIFPLEFEIQASHIINSSFAFACIFGFGKLNKEIFNKNIGKIVFVILFFYPIFFGHMAINSKDTILAFSHVWITYYIIRYLKNLTVKKKTNRFIFIISLLAAMATGIQMVYLGSLIPIFIFAVLDIFYLKIFVQKRVSLKKLFFDLIKFFVIFYLILILFWIDTYDNILILPLQFLIETFSTDYWTGWPFNLLNGDYYYSSAVPKTYLLTSFFYKSPEYIIFLYIVFLILLFVKNKLLNNDFKSFNIKISLFLIILLFPNLILFILPYPIYDGVRLFIWIIPYICTIPAISLYVLFKEYDYNYSKIISPICIILIVIYLFNFFKLTPYQYIYTNSLDGKKIEKYKKFEKDYWGISLKELINKSNFDKDEKILLATCGVNTSVVEKYMKQKYNRFLIVEKNKANYVIMTNRAIENNDNSEKEITNCFDYFEGVDTYSVIRNKQILSIIRKI